MLTKALGSKFFEKKKQPIPITLTRKEALPFAVQKNLRSTFMFLSAGTCVTVKAGNTSMPVMKLLENIQSITQAVPDKVPKKWSNIRSVSIKTSSSIALPIYNKTPQELEEIMRMAKGETKQAADEEKRSEESSKKKRVSTHLTKALKKQSREQVDVAPTISRKEKGDVESASEKTPKTKKRKEPVDATLRTSKKTKKSDSDIEKTKEENTSLMKTPKSSKKQEEDITSAKKSLKSSSNSDSLEGNFIASKKFVGSKNGYIFTKGKSGLGYYKDVKPVVDKAFLVSLGKRGGRKSINQTPQRRKGSSRRSY
jgi:ribosome biogenesis protein UTP30